MRLEWQPAPRTLGVPLWAVLVIGLWLALLSAVVAMEWAAGNDVVVCQFRALTGIPCPTCGSTRALLALAKGRLFEAFAHNPLAVTAGVFGVAWLVARVGFGRSVTVSPAMRARGHLWLLAAVLLLANWGYVIVRHLQHANQFVR